MSTGYSSQYLIERKPHPGVQLMAHRPSRPHVLDDEFDDNLFAGWTKVIPSGTATEVESYSALNVTMTSQLANHCVGYLKSMGTLGVGAMIETAYRSNFNNANYLMSGPLFTDGTAVGSNCIWLMDFLTTGENHSFRAGTLNNVVTNHFDTAAATQPRGWSWQRIHWVSANTWRAYWSADGIQWSDFTQGNKTTTLTPTHCGFGVSTWAGAAPAIASIEFFRVTP